MCGDGYCDAGETCGSCSKDCGVCPPVCGNGWCDAGEDCGSCAADCGSCGPVCGDGWCSIGEDCADCPYDCGWCGSDQDPCFAGPEPGSYDPVVTACVCDHDPYCCQNAWDAECAALVETLGCGVCSGPSCGDGWCDAGEDCGWCPEDCGDCEGVCSEPNGTPGCWDPDLTDCVCAADPYCCETAWDDSCVAQIEAQGCGLLGGDCCEWADVPGCSAPAVEACVCDADPYCCEVAWDETCVDQVTTLGCGLCE